MPDTAAKSANFLMIAFLSPPLLVMARKYASGAMRTKIPNLAFSDTDSVYRGEGIEFRQLRYLAAVAQEGT